METTRLEGGSNEVMRPPHRKGPKIKKNRYVQTQCTWCLLSKTRKKENRNTFDV